MPPGGVRSPIECVRCMRINVLFLVKDGRPK